MTERCMIAGCGKPERYFRLLAGPGEDMTPDPEAHPILGGFCSPEHAALPPAPSRAAVDRWVAELRQRGVMT
jgi:hypothetical protein